MHNQHMATASDLPPELVDEVLAYVLADRKDLFTCSLIAPTWTERARAHIFRRIDIRPVKVESADSGTIFDTEATMARVQHLHDALIRSPYVGELVQHVRFSLESASCAADTPLAPLLASVFRHLRAVQSVILTDIVWEGLASDVRDALVTVLEHPTMSSLTLSRITFPTFLDLAILVARLGPGPKALAIGDIVYHAALSDVMRAQFQALSERPASQRPTLIALEETSPVMRGAEFGALANWLANEYSCVEAHKVQRIFSSWTSLSMFLPLVRASCRSLRELQLCALVDISLSSRTSLSITLAELPALEALTLVNSQVDSYDPAPWLAAFLASRAGPTALARLTTRLVPPRRWYANPDEDPSTPLSMYDYAPWAEVDKVLWEGAADFPALRSVEFELANPRGMDVVRGVQMDAGMLRSTMLETKKRGLLRVYGSGVKR
ncbi:hypothetical protein K525DRAFT_230017 [Schizophyllum commune Loenen D]|nr:hypothetical protein K525DRAFT_230017 [Schizophyllum commune Loenen D]